MFRYLILVTLFFILFFTVSWVYGHFIAESETDVSFTYTKVSNGDFWDITVTFDGRTETTSKRKGGGISGFPVYGDESQYTVNVDGNGDVFGVRKYLPKDHRHADDGSVLGENDDQATAPPSTLNQTPDFSPDASSDPSPDFSPDASSDSTPGSPPDASSDPSPVNITPGTGNASTKAVAAPAPTKVMEYMLRDWSKSGGGGLPQWIELYNPNAKPISLEGYQFTHAYREFANAPWRYVTTSITGLTVPASDAVIIASKSVRGQPWEIGGISKEDVWIIPYNTRNDRFAQLKNGWHLRDPNGKLVHRIGTAFREYPADDPSDWEASLGRPRLPYHNSDGYRISYQRFPSETPDEGHFYGNQNDVGTPGFYKQAAPAAPSLQRPKLATTWGHLKMKK